VAVLQSYVRGHESGSCLVKRGNHDNHKSEETNGLIVGVGLSWATPVFADAVSDWNEIAAAAVSAGRPGESAKSIWH
jgi:hypothetical protein